MAVASLVLGLLSIPTLGLLLVGAILSLVFGIVALVKANRYPTQYGGHGLAVAGIVSSVASVLVMPFVLGVVAAIAIPTYLRRQVAQNETAAIANVRAVMAGQEAYRARSGGLYATLECLAAPAKCLPGYDGPPFVDTESAALAPRDGYRYFFDGNASLTSFAYVAVPLKPGQTGVRAFCGDASGRVCYTTDGAMPEVEGTSCPAAEDCMDLR
jgi:type II secretory pathway pseudopilin PulG